MSAPILGYTVETNLDIGNSGSLLSVNDTVMSWLRL
jgi:hypothetical protein